MRSTVSTHGSYAVIVEDAVVMDGERTVGRIRRFRTGYGSVTDSGLGYGNFRPTFEEAKEALVVADEQQNSRR